MTTSVIALSIQIVANFIGVTTSSYINGQSYDLILTVRAITKLDGSDRIDYVTLQNMLADWELSAAEMNRISGDSMEKEL